MGVRWCGAVMWTWPRRSSIAIAVQGQQQRAGLSDWFRSVRANIVACAFDPLLLGNQTVGGLSRASRSLPP